MMTERTLLCRCYDPRVVHDAMGYDLRSGSNLHVLDVTEGDQEELPLDCCEQWIDFSHCLNVIEAR